MHGVSKSNVGFRLNIAVYLLWKNEYFNSGCFVLNMFFLQVMVGCTEVPSIYVETFSLHYCRGRVKLP